MWLKLLTIEQCFINPVPIVMVRKLIIITISLLFLSACATTSENQTDENISSNEKVINNSVEEAVVKETASEAVSEPASNNVNDSSVITSERSDINSDDGSASHELSESSDANKKTQVTDKQPPEEHAKAHSEKGLGNHIFNNGPTKQVIKSLEGVTDALNVMTFGIFASGARPAQ
ncbi:conserved hypothetical protein [Vibrio chagasii]|nr:conserved hypothetical protein [Vibrio chagasii]CAH6957898.1 conserved hypothetical protein [Vibrio chagasii]CAH6961530.1 conserved hypothetical protein [Vibrio chagasii]CAH6981244.1 conserved hypothetical protein [Vibrio chagasii]CAH7150833.1 conserved hypothetical protein [Vibrio chagasii]